MKTVREWFAEGERVPFNLASEGDRTVHISVHVFKADDEVDRPWVTFLHGFPTCAYDYHHLAEALKGRFNMLLWDYLGYGDSDKDLGPSFSVHTLADLQQQLWTHYAIEHTHIVAHDLGDTVLQELVARAAQLDGGAMPIFHRVFIFNGGIFPQLHRPVLMQHLLLTPVIGPFFSRTATEGFCARRIRRIFSKEHPPSKELVHEMYEAGANRGGRNIYHRLVTYVRDRKRHSKRWQHAIEVLVAGQLGPQARVCFFWGLEDPISGAHMIAEVHARCQRLYGQSTDGDGLIGQSDDGYTRGGQSPDSSMRNIESKDDRAYIGQPQDGRALDGESGDGQSYAVPCVPVGCYRLLSPLTVLSQSGTSDVKIDESASSSRDLPNDTPYGVGDTKQRTRTHVRASDVSQCVPHAPVRVYDEGRARVCVYGREGVCRVVERKDLGHWPFIEDPEAVATHVLCFLTGGEGV